MTIAERTSRQASAFLQEAVAPIATPSTTAYIQIVRIIDRDTGDFLAPSTQQHDRIVTGQTDATQNGWAVDRIDGREWGYYARNNDGTFASYLTMGTNTSPAVLGDGPSGGSITAGSMPWTRLSRSTPIPAA